MHACMHADACVRPIHACMQCATCAHLPPAPLPQLQPQVDMDETGRTEPKYNTQEPKWDHPVQLTLPQGAECTMNKNPLVRIAVYDKVRVTWPAGLPVCMCT